MSTGNILKYVGGIAAFLIASTLGRTYPGIIVQLLVAYVLYWIGKKIVLKSFSSSTSQDDSRKKYVYILSGLGLLGFISPILGFVFALPAYLIATELITTKYESKSNLTTIATIVVAICLLNAAYGAYLHQNTI